MVIDLRSETKGSQFYSAESYAWRWALYSNRPANA